MTHLFCQAQRKTKIETSNVVNDDQQLQTLILIN